MKKWYFKDRQAAAGAQQDDSDSPPGLVNLPEALLERHGARVLDPGKAAAPISHDPTSPPPPPPRPTIYRARTLLVPGHLLQDVDSIRDVNDALVDVGMALTEPMQDDDLAEVPDTDLPEGARGIIQELLQLPRTAVLVPRDRHPTPVVVDAWVALQALRAAASPDHQYLNHENVPQIGLEHLATGSGITGSPIGNQGGGIAGSPGGSPDVSGPSPTDSYLFSGGDPRFPVAVLLHKPAYKSEARCASEYGRRPVLAVLDTGLGPHPWLGVETDGAGGYTITAGAPVADDPGIQAAIYAEGKHAKEHGDRPRQLIKDVWDKPMTANPLVGELNPASGHGTFIAGIVRQVAPDAKVLAVRVMQSDDVAYEGDILCALRHLAKRIALGAPVDVISLSFGYFSESPAYAAETSALGKTINVLLGLGVVVVAAAGNYATTRKFYPAAFAADALPGELSVISVGALNPNGTTAMFSDDGPWVTALAQGAAVLSTYPIDINASRSPELTKPADPMTPHVGSPSERAALKLDDFIDGFALWSGTSFSAPHVAARIIVALQEGATVPEGATPEVQAEVAKMRLNQPGRYARALATVEHLRQQDNQSG